MKGTRCTCADRSGWRVTALRCNYSAFNGYQRTESDYSEVICVECGGRWRTKAAYVDALVRAETEADRG